jgi:tRNA1Val (adenine37-N6)-methyltransferase
MANPYFSFKQFTVYHDRCAMKVGIDGVLLGAWSNVGDSKHILDIGTGTGLIALMLAQRSNSFIEAIEIDKDAVDQAMENIEHSPWTNRIKVQEISLQSYAKITPQRYDLIVSNPPYFVNSLKTPSLNRTTARHTDTLTHEELILNSIALLKPTGRICIILPVNEAELCKSFALSKKVYCTREVKVIPKPNAEAKRILMEFSLQFSPVKITKLVIESNERHHYSAEFSELAQEFYLKL